MLMLKPGGSLILSRDNVWLPRAAHATSPMTRHGNTFRIRYSLIHAPHMPIDSDGSDRHDCGHVQRRLKATFRPNTARSLNARLAAANLLRSSDPKVGLSLLWRLRRLQAPVPSAVSNSEASVRIRPDRSPESAAVLRRAACECASRWLSRCPPGDAQSRGHSICREHVENPTPLQKFHGVRRQPVGNLLCTS